MTVVDVKKGSDSCLNSLLALQAYFFPVSVSGCVCRFVAVEIAWDNFREVFCSRAQCGTRWHRFRAQQSNRAAIDQEIPGAYVAGQTAHQRAGEITWPS